VLPVKSVTINYLWLTTLMLELMLRSVLKLKEIDKDGVVATTFFMRTSASKLFSVDLVKYRMCERKLKEFFLEKRCQTALKEKK